MLLHKPKELSWEQAAGIPEVIRFIQSCSPRLLTVAEILSRLG